ncbi:MAG: hypothetical protein AB2L14_27220 [Candidatus Xenobiia bacterium LiM19]
MSTTPVGPSQSATAAAQSASPRHAMEYSDRGKKLAEDIYDRAGSSATADDANAILWKGYKTIIADGATTEDEKTIARFGQATSQRTLATTEHNRMAFKVISCLAHPIAGPVAQVLAQVATATAGNVTLAEPEAHVFWKGFEAIEKNPHASADEKAVAKLGSTVASVALPWAEHDLAARPIMQTLCNTIQGPIGVTLANAAYASARNVNNAESAARVLYKGFDALAGNSSATDMERAIAGLGSDIGSISLIWTEHDKAAYPIMQALRNTVSGPAGMVLAKAAYASARNVDNAETAARVMWKGFDAIEGNASATADEKAVAGLGSAIASVKLQWTEHDKAEYPVMQALCNAISGPIGVTLADIAYKSAEAVDNADSAAHVLYKGFSSISKNTGSTAEEKALADFGDSLGQISLKWTEHDRIAYPIMKVLKNGLKGSLSEVLADAAYKSASNCEFAETADRVIWKAYDAIGKEPQLSPGHKAILELGQAMSHNTIDWVEHNHLGFPILDALRKPVTGPVPLLVAAMSYNTGKNCSSSDAAAVALNEGFKAIAARDDSTSLQKSFAQLGLEIGTSSGLPADNANELRFQVMKRLIDSSEEHAAEEGKPKPLDELRAEVKSLKGKIEASKKQVAEYEQKNVEDSASYDPLYKDYEKVDKKVKLFGKAAPVLKIGGAATAFAALAMTQPLLFIPAAIAFGTLFMKQSFDTKRARLVADLNGINARIEERKVDIRMEKQEQAIYEKEIALFQPQIEVYESAEALQKPTEEIPIVTNPEDDDSFIEIGGIKLEIKKHGTPGGEKDRMNPDHEKGHL